MVTQSLSDCSLQEHTLETLPRLAALRKLSFDSKPAICVERARYITRYLQKHDLPEDTPEIRQAKSVRYFLEHKSVDFWDVNLLAGSTTSKPLGAPLFPEFFALYLWPELDTVSTREKNPMTLTAAEADELNFDIFPFWMDRNVIEIARAQFGNQTCLQLFENLSFFLAGKAGCISHAVPLYSPMLEHGLEGLIEMAVTQENQLTSDISHEALQKRDFYRAIQIALQGIMVYAEHLAEETEYLAEMADQPELEKHFSEIAKVCRHIPAKPARTFREAVNAIWICQVGIHAENINMAMSPGRLDQILWPYYQKDIAEGSLDVAEAIELLGCLWLKLSDNVTMVPEASEEMFGGAGTVPAVTLGGVDKNGNDCVNDLTYIMLRVTELLQIRDPNVNARYHYDVNSSQYCRRVSDVIINTKAVPAFFNDVKNIEALMGQGETLEHARDYAVIGCVELASSGRDYPASSSIMLNLVACMEMALYQGKRPITEDDQIGPVTAAPENINSFEDFWEIFKEQTRWLIDQAVQLNEIFGAIHQQMMPSPLLSAFFEGPMEKGRDLIRGGARYNSSGTTHIGFANVVDSLNAIEHAVFTEHKYTLAELIAAVKNNFSGGDGEKMRVYLKNRAPKFGTEHPIARKNARNLTRFLFQTYQSYTNYRGGKYRPAYWTMTNHAGLGAISSALPDGRRANELLASGMTPVSGAAPELTACLNAVAELGGVEIPGCWALNMKYTPEDDKQAMGERFAQTVEAYFRSGGQQVQFNIMTYKMLLDAKKNPQNYPELMVRVSGYSAYFKHLNEHMKDELITRTQYNLTNGHAVDFPE
ncbi:MAG: pyruvate formate-lyase/glycerol dehydratase family glycyl radical enzyme [Desulforhopalus sp.]|jgi:pyruvate formate-lyase/glycerol dehydratase family glycyl radical enzyme